MKQFSDQTVSGTSLNNSQKYADKVYLTSRYDQQGRRTEQLHPYTWGQADRIIRDLCAAMLALGFKELDRAAVFSPNQPRWIFASHAAICCRGAMVPIYPTSKVEDVWWILHDSGSRFCFCGKDQLPKVLEVKDKVKTLEKIILFEPMDKPSDPRVMSFEEFIELGKQNRQLESEVEKLVDKTVPEDVVALIYTSGTTGRPKGVMLTHSNVVSQRSVIGEFGFTPDDIFMAHLPMCHSYGFSADLLGAGYVPAVLAVLDSLSSDEIKWGLQNIRPTVMNSVPRLWEKLYIQINATLRERPPFLQKLFSWGIKVGKEIYILNNEKKSVPFTLTLQAKLTQPLFSLVRKKAGLDRLRLCSTGGGPINPDLIVFFGAMGIKLFQGFGLTETSPIINANTPQNNKLGTCGKPLPGVIEKIAEDGEILVKGPQVMKGYWNNVQANKEVFTQDGFFLTGDIGFIDEEGFLTITDRKKELFKTSGGKYVAPQPIEYEFNTDPFMEQVTLIGDAKKFCSALIVPEFNALCNFAKEKGISYKDNCELVKHPEVVALMQSRVDLVNQRLARYEQIKKFAILDRSFSEEGGELTPSQKKKRRVIEKKYKNLIDQMYPPEE